MEQAVIPIFLFAACVIGLSAVLIVLGNLFNPGRVQPVKRMPYESGMDPIHDTRRRLDIRFHLMAIAFLVFDVELLFLYPWAVAARPGGAPRAEAAAPAEQTEAETTEAGATAAEATGVRANRATPAGPLGIDGVVSRKGYVANRHLVFGGVMVFVALLAVGFIYDWRKGVFNWR